MKTALAPVYFKNLDGLRAIAALAVIFFHLSFWFPYPATRFYSGLKFVFASGGDGGSLGVTFFFILSGFLITYLMFVEQQGKNKINIIHFYFRRILRIWPLYFLTLFIGFFVYPLFLHVQGKNYDENASVILYMLFAANFDHIFNGGPGSGILGVQWSVAIEEQFYLLWPLVFYVFGKKKIFPFLLLALIVISELFYIKATLESVAYYHFMSNLRFLAFGGLLAYLCYYYENLVVSYLNRINPLTHLLIYFMCFSSIIFHKYISELLPYFKYLYHLLPFLFFGYVILEQNFSERSFFKIGSLRILNWLGKISYGLYLTHMIAIYTVIGLFPGGTAFTASKIISSLVLTITLSYFSYTYFESFFLSFKKKFSSI